MFSLDKPAYNVALYNGYIESNSFHSQMKLKVKMLDEALFMFQLDWVLPKNASVTVYVVFLFQNVKLGCQPSTRQPTN